MDITFLILIIALAAMLFFTTSRSRKQQRAAAEFREGLQPGVEVMTQSGMVGVVVAVDTARQLVRIESSDGHVTDWVMPAVKEVPAQFATPVPDDSDDTDVSEVTEQEGSGSTIGPDVIDVPDDISGLDSAQREYRDQQARKDDDTDGK
ncbi:preprotein translocase subunit YajC [Myceligenerans xiligouense]|uniref:Preprotein translocase subunit YajC n=1 Tax=Myceligenerans xiligouense TaxID=253184 RepID=A0A3N4ZJL4_9MICO|nr:preprotein translocase subunit YajC [Myceligenerans xiligouense]RPF21105.1 preprotein translocase subunit YajC [Myceligenerans xiligouense]